MTNKVFSQADDDIDGDGIANEEDDDIDGDGIANNEDNNPDSVADGDIVAGGEQDTDGDGLADSEDDDDDNDGIADSDDDDDDGDGIPDSEEEENISESEEDPLLAAFCGTKIKVTPVAGTNKVKATCLGQTLSFVFTQPKDEQGNPIPINQEQFPELLTGDEFIEFNGNTSWLFYPFKDKTGNPIDLSFKSDH